MHCGTSVSQIEQLWPILEEKCVKCQIKQSRLVNLIAFDETEIEVTVGMTIQRRSTDYPNGKALI